MKRETELNNSIAYLELPKNMRSLKISDEGYPIPWFVGYPDGPDGKEDFRCIDGEKMRIAVRLKRCWLCGQPLGKFMTFPIGSMCVVNRNIAEPPSHLACCEFSVRACPFLSRPRMRRNEKDAPQGHVAGIGIKRNPGVVALWTTLSYRVFRAPNGGALFEIGKSEHIEFYAEGRNATREEILASMESGLQDELMPRAVAEGSDAVAELQAMYDKALTLVPAA
jgi:hypothetical protein